MRSRIIPELINLFLRWIRKGSIDSERLNEIDSNLLSANLSKLS